MSSWLDLGSFVLSSIFFSRSFIVFFFFFLKSDAVINTCFFNLVF